MTQENAVKFISHFFKGTPRIGVFLSAYDLEGSNNFGKIKYGLNQFLANPGDYLWQDFIRRLVMVPMIYIFPKGTMDTLIQSFEELGVIVKKKFGNLGIIIKDLEVSFSSFSPARATEQMNGRVSALFPKDFRETLERIIDCLKKVYFVENTARVLIIQVDKTRNQLQISNSIKMSIGTRKKEQKAWIPTRGSHDLYWTTLGELTKIIETNRQYLISNGLMKGTIKDILSILTDIEPFRNFAAHNPYLAPSDEHKKILEGIWLKHLLLIEKLEKERIYQSF